MRWVNFGLQGQAVPGQLGLGAEPVKGFVEVQFVSSGVCDLDMLLPLAQGLS
jgi:hypothetical protein